MPWSSRSHAPATTADAVVEYDDGGSGLLEACKSRFAASGCTIACDASHTVWVTTADKTRSVGLPGWQLTRHSADELLDGVEAKLGLTASAHR